MSLRDGHTEEKKAPQGEPFVQEAKTVQDECATDLLISEDDKDRRKQNVDVQQKQCRPCKAWGRFKFAVICVALILCFVAGVLAGETKLLLFQAELPFIQINTHHAYEKSEELSERVFELSRLLEKEAVQDFDLDKLSQTVYEHMLEGLGDDYAYYFTPEQFKNFQEETQGSFGGIGVVLSQKKDGAYIYKVYANTPADRAGLQPGDKIVSVDGEHRDLWTVNELAARLRSAPQTAHTLAWISYDKDGKASKEKSAELTTEEIEYPSVSYENLGGIGLIAVRKFTDQTAEQTKAALEALQGEKVKGIILDMRSNPGGPLSQAIQLSSQFLGKQKIVMTELRGGVIQDEFSSDDAISNLPLVVVIDENSASSTEIVSSALQDYKRALIVGQLSYGKGTVQIVHKLSSGGGVKFTIAHYLSALGNKVDKQGVLPDVLVKFQESDKVSDLKHQSLAVKSLDDKEYPEQSAERLQEILEHDHQLARGYELMQEVLTAGTLELQTLDNPPGSQPELTREAREARDELKRQTQDRQ